MKDFKKNRDAQERASIRQQARRKDEQLEANAATIALSDWLFAATPSQTFAWFDLTFKKERQTAFGKRIPQPSRNPTVHNEPVPSAAVPTWKIATIDDRTVNVRVKPRTKQSMRDAAKLATVEYLPENEPARSVVRIINFLNAHFFKGRARRTKNPERLTCLAALHDRDDTGKPCRPHIHAVVGIPPHVPVAEFRSVLRRAASREPFIYRRMSVEKVQDLQKAVAYATKPDKSSVRDATVYLHPARSAGKEQHD